MARRKRKVGAPRWRSKFLRALAGSGNVRAAALAAGIDFTSAYGLRKRHPPFARAWARAVRIARARVAAGAQAAGAGPGPGPLHHASPVPTLRVGLRGRQSPGLPRMLAPPPPGKLGEEFVLRVSKRRGAQLVRPGAGRWSGKAEDRFLAALRETACVRRAAAAAGFSTTALYRRRQSYPAFAARWRAIEEEGKARLHALVVEAGLAAFDPAFGDEDTPKASVAEAIAILRLKGVPGAPGGTGAPAADEGPTIEEVRDEILRRLAAIRRHRAKYGGGADGGE